MTLSDYGTISPDTKDMLVALAIIISGRFLHMVYLRGVL